MDKRDFYKQMITLVYQDRSGGGGAGQGSDPKGVNVTTVGLDIRLRMLYVMFPRWGLKTHPVQPVVSN